LSKVSSFGFRGEGLSSLCEACESLSITTRTAQDQAGIKLDYNKAGDVIGRQVVSRSIGTTVTVTKLCAFVSSSSLFRLNFMV